MNSENVGEVKLCSPSSNQGSFLTLLRVELEHALGLLLPFFESGFDVDVCRECEGEI